MCKRFKAIWRNEFHVFLRSKKKLLEIKLLLDNSPTSRTNENYYFEVYYYLSTIDLIVKCNSIRKYQN